MLAYCQFYPWIQTFRFKQKHNNLKQWIEFEKASREMETTYSIITVITYNITNGSLSLQLTNKREILILKTVKLAYVRILSYIK